MSLKMMKIDCRIRTEVSDNFGGKEEIWPKTDKAFTELMHVLDSARIDSNPILCS